MLRMRNIIIVGFALIQDALTQILLDFADQLVNLVVAVNLLLRLNLDTFGRFGWNTIHFN